jgi:mono/diheme cytochrome c family protein
LNKYFLPLILLLLLGCEKEETNTTKPLHVKPPVKALHVDEIKEELSKIDTIPYIETYIEKIINEGSNQNLGFPTKTMDAGIAHAMDAQNIARYVMTLRGQKSTDDMQAKKAEIFYTSNCGGCHGNDAKGLNGTFPDLTIQTMLGIEKRREFLLSKLKD